MRRTGLLFASVALVVLLACGVALAVTKDCEDGAATCEGTNDSDTLNGSEETDEMFGFDGEDELIGNGGDVEITGGADNDHLLGGIGTDYLKGTKGSDTSEGGEDADTIADYSPGNDELFGDSGADNLIDFHGANLLSGGGGADQLTGHNKLNGGAGNDVIDAVYEYRSDDRPRTVIGGSGTDEITSSGNIVDTIYAQDGERDSITCGGGTDKVYFDKGIDFVDLGNCERRISEPQ